MIQVTFGLTMFLSLLIPSHFLIQLLLGDMYAVLFSSTISSLSILISFGITLFIPFIISIIFVKKSNLISRLPFPIPSQNLMLLGSFFILLPSFLQIILLMIDKIYNLTLVHTYFVSIKGMSNILFFVNYIAKVLLIVGVFQLLLSVKQNSRYLYWDNTEL